MTPSNTPAVDRYVCWSRVDCRRRRARPRPAHPPGHLTTRRFAGCARSDGGSVHGCKSVGRDTVGAGIEFAASCQGGDFLTDSLGGQCGIEALQEAVERNSFALGMCGSRRVSQSCARVEPWHCRNESDAELLTVGFLCCESRHEQDGRLCSGVSAADRGTLKCGAAGDSNHHAPRIQGSQQRLACPVEYVADVDLPVAAERLPTVFVQRPK